MTESTAGRYGGGLRSDWNVRSDWTRYPRLQLVRNGTASLERHVGQPAAPNRPMARAAGAARERLDTEHSTAYHANSDVTAPLGGKPASH